MGQAIIRRGRIVDRGLNALPGVDRDLVQVLSKNIDKKFSAVFLNTKVTCLTCEIGDYFRNTSLSAAVIMQAYSAVRGKSV